MHYSLYPYHLVFLIWYPYFLVFLIWYPCALVSLYGNTAHCSGCGVVMGCYGLSIVPRTAIVMSQWYDRYCFVEYARMWAKTPDRQRLDNANARWLQTREVSGWGWPMVHPAADNFPRNVCLTVSRNHAIFLSYLPVNYHIWYCLVACSTLNHYLHQCLLSTGPIRNKFPWNFNRNTKRNSFGINVLKTEHTDSVLIWNHTIYEIRDTHISPMRASYGCLLIPFWLCDNGTTPYIEHTKDIP